MSDENVIDAAHWLFKHAERLIAEDSDAAIPYLERLVVATQDRELRVFCLKNLGILHMGRGDLDDARKYLRSATALSPRDPELHHALGQVAASSGHFWLALLEFLEALHHGRNREDVVGYMRSIAATMRQLEFGEIGLSVLIGAYERAPDDPFVLDSLARFYESRQRWLDAIEARDQLIEVLEARRALASEREPLMLDDESARRRVQDLSRQLKKELRLVDDTHDHHQPSELARLHFPSGLHTLIQALGLRSHNLPLLKTAEVLWARALDKKFDVHLSIPTLAAAIHWIVERLHWRVPTTMADLGRLYEADLDRLPAAVRLLVACLEVELLPLDAAGGALPRAELERLEKLQKAILYDVDLDHVEPRGMLGGNEDD